MVFNLGISIILIVLITLIAIGTIKINNKTASTKEFYALGTYNQLIVHGKKSKKAIEKAINRINEIENKMSVFREKSEISKINVNAGKEAQIVSVDTYFVIKRAIEYCYKSKGAFDITIRPLVELWKIGRADAQVPPSYEIQEKLQLVNYKDVILNENNRSVLLKNEKQELDLGGIAKGYAADEVKKVLLMNHIRSAIINLGGNIVVIGKNDGAYWKIGIQNPIRPRGEFVGIVSVIDKSIVTSGNYERYFERNGKKYHHIINPDTGYPSENDIISATIISDYSIDGDGLSTGIYIMGLYKAIKLIEGINGVEAIFITKDKEVYVTSGMKEKFILTNNEFIYNK